MRRHGKLPYVLTGVVLAVGACMWVAGLWLGAGNVNCVSACHTASEPALAMNVTRGKCLIAVLSVRDYVRKALGGHALIGAEAGGRSYAASADVPGVWDRLRLMCLNLSAGETMRITVYSRTCAFECGASPNARASAALKTAGTVVMTGALVCFIALLASERVPLRRF